MISRRRLTAAFAIAGLGVIAWLAWSSSTSGAMLAPAVTWDDSEIAETIDATEPVAVSAEFGSDLEREDVEPGSSPVPPPRAGVDQRRARIVGRIVTRDGRPIAEARIRLQLVATNNRSRRSRKVQKNAASASDGRFAFEGPAPVGARLFVRAAHPGFAALLVAPDVKLAEDGATTDLGDLTLGPGAALRGRVEDSTGRPVAAASVTLRLQLGGSLGELAAMEARSVDCDGAGTFYVERLAAGVYSVGARARGYLRGTLRSRPRVAEGDSDDVGVIVLKPGAVIAGRIEDGRGAPIARASVRLSSRASGRGRSERTRSRGDGTFEFLHAPASEVYELQLEAKGYLGLRETLTASSRDLSRLVLRMEDGLVIAGTVFDERSGAPVEHYAIRAERAGGLLSASGRGDRPADARARAREIERQQRRLRRRRLRAGEPEAHPAGAFRITGLDEGTYRLVVASPEHASMATELFEMPRTQPLHTERVVLIRGLLVSGITSEDGETPLADVRLDLVAVPSGSTAPLNPGTPPPGDRVARSISGDDGRFEFERVAPGRYFVRARKSGRTNAWTESFALDSDRSGLRLDLPAAATIRGVVRGAIEASAEAGSISVIAFARAGLGRMAVATTTADGSYEISGVQPGDYTVNAFLGGVRDHMRSQFSGLGRNEPRIPRTGFRVRVASGGDYTVDPELEVPARGRVEGKVLQNGTPPAGARIRLSAAAPPGRVGSGPRIAETRVTADGSFTLADVPAGPHVLTVTASRGSNNELHRETIVVVDGGTTQASISIVTARVSGRIVGISGDPKSIRGLVMLLPGQSSVPESMRDHQRDHRVHRIRVRDGSFGASGIDVGPALAIVRIADRVEATQQVWIQPGFTELELRAGATTPEK